MVRYYLQMVVVLCLGSLQVVELQMLTTLGLSQPLQILH